MAACWASRPVAVLIAYAPAISSGSYTRLRIARLLRYGHPKPSASASTPRNGHAATSQPPQSHSHEAAKNTGRNETHALAEDLGGADSIALDAHTAVYRYTNCQAEWRESPGPRRSLSPPGLLRRALSRAVPCRARAETIEVDRPHTFCSEGALRAGAAVRLVKSEARLSLVQIKECPKDKTSKG